MKYRILSIILFCVAFTPLKAHDGKPNNTQFIENKGQWDNRIAYKASLYGGEIFLEKNIFTFKFWDINAVRRLHASKGDNLKPQTNINAHSFKLKFLNANLQPTIVAEDATEGYKNYYLGKDPSKWASRVLAYHKVVYQGLYDGVDLNVLSHGNNMKYEFIVAPNISPNTIQIAIDGADKVFLKDGNLVIRTSINEIIEQQPYAYQLVNGIEKEVACNYVLVGNKLSYQLSDGYDKSIPLVIDPTLVFSSYSGSTEDNWGYTATYDANGDLYTGGITFNTGYPTSVGAYQINYGGGSADVTLSKYTANGTAYLFSTYLGGDDGEQPHSLIVNSANELYVYGTTGSFDFPTTTGAFDVTYNGGNPTTVSNIIDFTAGSDIFITRFAFDGTALLSSTFFGGSGNDGLNQSPILNYNYADHARGEIYVDNFNNVYVASSTSSNNIPVTTGAYQTVNGGGQDACIMKFDNNLTSLIWSTYLGKAGDEGAYSIYVDNNFKVFFTGGTSSQNFPTSSGAIFTSYQGGQADAYVAELSNDGQQLLHSTYYGTGSLDQSYFVQLDKLGNVYLLGQTLSSGTTLIQNAAYNTPGGNQFVCKLNPTLTSTVWSTRFGNATGLTDIVPSAFLVDVCNKVYISGWGGAVNPQSAGTTGLEVTNNAYQSTTDGSDYYLLVIDDNASQILYGSFFGSPISPEHVDGGTSRFDKQGVIYQSVCAGCGGDSNFPTTLGVVSNTNNSFNCNNGVFKFNFDFPSTVANFSFPPLGCAPQSINFNNTSTGALGYVWDFGDNSPTSTQQTPTHSYNEPGTYNVTLIATNPNNCNIADTVVKQIIILGNTSTTLQADTTCPGVPVSVGIPPLSDPNVTYSWSPAAAVTNPSAPNTTANVSVNTTLTLLVTNGNCTDTIRQDIIIDGNINLDAGPDFTICDGQQVSIGFIDNSGLYNYTWSPATGLSDPTISNPIANPTQTTTYLLTSSSNGGVGCGGVDSVTITVTNAPPAADFTYTVLPNCDGLGIFLDNQSSSTGPFYWSLGGAPIPSLGDTTVVIAYNQSYSFSLIVGIPPCSDTSTVTVNATSLSGAVQVTEVNFFSPNGDSFNPCFSPIIPPSFGGNITEYPLLACSELIIYNRWGNKLWEGAGCWDGKTMDGTDVSEGTYFYIFSIDAFEHHGYVQLNR